MTFWYPEQTEVLARTDQIVSDEKLGILHSVFFFLKVWRNPRFLHWGRSTLEKYLTAYFFFAVQVAG